jgi:hypothetical protein
MRDCAWCIALIPRTSGRPWQFFAALRTRLFLMRRAQLRVMERAGITQANSFDRD